MARSSLAVFVLAAMGGCHSSAERPGGEARRPVGDRGSPRMMVTVFVEIVGLAALGERADSPRLIAAVMGDGRVLWSENQIVGGRPYFQARIDAHRIDALRRAASLLVEGAAQGQRDNWFGPDSEVTRIRVALDGKSKEMASWHELFEGNPKLVVTDRGVEVLGERSRQEVEAGVSDEYRNFLDRWNRIRKAVRDCIPARGEPVEVLPEEILANIGA